MYLFGIDRGSQSFQWMIWYFFFGIDDLVDFFIHTCGYNLLGKNMQEDWCKGNEI